MQLQFAIRVEIRLKSRGPHRSGQRGIGGEELPVLPPLALILPLSPYQVAGPGGVEAKLREH